MTRKAATCAFALALSLTAILSAQSTSSTVSGQITDPTGSSVPGASVTLRRGDVQAEVEREVPTVEVPVREDVLSPHRSSKREISIRLRCRMFTLE